MRAGQEKPNLKTILKNILQQEDYFSPYVNNEEKLYFLNNFDSIKTFKGYTNEIAIIKKKWVLIKLKQ